MLLTDPSPTENTATVENNSRRLQYMLYCR